MLLLDLPISGPVDMDKDITKDMEVVTRVEEAGIRAGEMDIHVEETAVDMAHLDEEAVTKVDEEAMDSVVDRGADTPTEAELRATRLGTREAAAIRWVYF